MKLRHLMLAILMVTVWGFNITVTKIGLTEIPPLTFCFTRFLLASVPLVFFVKKPAMPFKILLLYSLVMFSIQFTLIFFGMNMGVSAGITSILIQAQIFVTILLAIWFLGEKPNKWQVISSLIAFAGIAIIGFHLKGSVSLGGFILILLATICWGIGNIIARKFHNADMFALIVWSSFLAWPLLLLCAIFVEGTTTIAHTLSHLSWQAILSILYIAYPSTIFAFAAWSYLLKKYHAATVAPFSLLIPIVGMASAALVLSESFPSWKLIAAFLVILGLGTNLVIAKLLSKHHGHPLH